MRLRQQLLRERPGQLPCLEDQRPSEIRNVGGVSVRSQWVWDFPIWGSVSSRLLPSSAVSVSLRTCPSFTHIHVFQHALLPPCLHPISGRTISFFSTSPPPVSASLSRILDVVKLGTQHGCMYGRRCSLLATKEPEARQSQVVVRCLCLYSIYVCSIRKYP